MTKRFDDKVKMRIAKEQSFEYVEFWEYDIHDNWNSVSKNWSGKWKLLV